MKFGKVPDPTALEYHLPVEPLANRARLDRYELGAGEGRPRIYIGATGWSMKEWVGKWYPEGTRPADYLQRYGEQFNTIEMNTTHYRIPTAEMVKKWYDSVPEDFRFCPKVPQFISHSGQLGAGDGGLQKFVGALDGLREKLGCAFIQLPPYFGVDRLPILDAFLGRWPRVLPLAVEVRHESWFSDPFATEALMDTLARHAAAAVITDVAGRRDVLHGYVTAPRTMIRFVGNGLIESDFTRLADWARKLREWNLPETFIFPHEPDNVLAPDAAAWLAGHLAAQDFAETRGPASVQGPEQMSLF
ncbi:uncharacterized protein YecE (DUF72 family) [Lewinella marina]|uniref:DUF72 domain-containing protein n=1 Tax=Neolewinella marina TaxID=438751 RepID=A0A2G0CIJ9_9BACT|nr:DUF72 domain-containing protein [Neolewinella marina]NJB85123.1 uncharacterized protein YecE (DUF72 family) [Neolewinella marina]PHK99740.1 hypothetical protein CGL56_01440 [Neolewinella marina]